MPKAVRWNEWCTPSMGANLWGESPLWEYQLELILTTRITTSRRQGQAREGLSEGSPSARGARRRTETAYKAEGCEASWHMTAKPTGTQPTVNAALVHRQFASLPGEICTACGARRWRQIPDGSHRVTKNQAPRRAARRVSKKRQQPPSKRAARPAATPAVTAQKSADAVVGGQASGR